MEEEQQIHQAMEVQLIVVDQAVVVIPRAAVVVDNYQSLPISIHHNSSLKADYLDLIITVIIRHHNNQGHISNNTRYIRITVMTVLWIWHTTLIVLTKRLINQTLQKSE